MKWEKENSSINTACSSADWENYFAILINYQPSRSHVLLFQTFMCMVVFFLFFFLRHHALEFTPSPHPLPACRLKESRSAPPPPPTSRRAGGAPAWDRLPAPVREELVHQDFQIWTGRVQFGPHTSAPHDTAPQIGTVKFYCRVH